MHERGSASRELVKTVIHIGGSAYSGSTLLDMTLANDPRGFSCGEVHALFHPFRSHHLDPRCACGDAECDVWSQVRAAGERNVYSTIFERLPTIDFIVDSSKPSVWIRDQAERSRRLGLRVVHLLIWKTPEEFYNSRARRGETAGWAQAWVNYHRFYFANVSKWRSIRYSDLVTRPEALQEVCDFISIPYFAQKHEYWRKTHHTLFGNATAKIHMYDASSDRYKEILGELPTSVGVNGDNHHSHRKIELRTEEARTIPSVSDQMRRQFEAIQDTLASGAIGSAHPGRVTPTVPRRARMNPIFAYARRPVYRLKRLAATIRLRLGSG
jgi:hypothetical protein